MRREDLRVEEDGVLQTITHFSIEVSPVGYALVVDNTGSLRVLMNFIIAAAGSLIEGNQSGDETMLVRFVDSEHTERVGGGRRRETQSQRAFRLSCAGRESPGEARRERRQTVPQVAVNKSSLRCRDRQKSPKSQKNSIFQRAPAVCGTFRAGRAN